MIKHVFALLSIGCILYACKKDDDKPSNNTNEKVQLMTSSTWKYDTVGLDNDNNGQIDAALPAPYAVATCDKDNTVTFKSDSTGVVNEGAVKCNAGDPQTTPFTWWFKDNYATLYTPDDIFGNAFVTGDFQVGEITSTKMRIIKKVSGVNIVVQLKH